MERIPTAEVAEVEVSVQEEEGIREIVRVPDPLGIVYVILKE